MDLGAVFSHRLAVDGQRVLMDELALHQFVDDRRNAAGAVIFFAKIFASGLHVDEEGHLVPDRLPILNRKRHADVAGDGVDVDRRIGRAANGAVDDDRVLERLARQDVRRLQVLPHHFDDPLASSIGDLTALTMGGRDCGAARQAHAERLGERVHGRGRAHRVAMADRWRGRGDDLHELLVVDLAFGKVGARLPDDGARAAALAVMPAVEHRSAGEDDGGNVDRRRRHDAGRRRLVAAGRQHDAVDEIAHQDFDEAKIGEIAVERRGRPLSRLLNRVDRKFERQSPGRGDAVAHTLGEFEVMAVAGRKIGAGLGDADDRLAGAQFAGRQAEIEIALEIERRHSRVVRIVEPLPGSQRRLGRLGPPFDLVLDLSAINLVCLPGAVPFVARRCHAIMDRIAERIQCFARAAHPGTGRRRVRFASSRERRDAKQPEVQAADQQRVEDEANDDCAGRRAGSPAPDRRRRCAGRGRRSLQDPRPTRRGRRRTAQGPQPSRWRRDAQRSIAAPPTASDDGPQP